MQMTLVMQDSYEVLFWIFDSTKMNMTKTIDQASLQGTCHRGHKRFYCLIYQKLTILVGVMFAKYGP